MNTISTKRPYAILVQLPEGDPMAMPHLLGDNWASCRWYETASQRDAALLNMRRQPGNYRLGDKPSVILERLDPGTESWDHWRERTGVTEAAE